MKSTILYQLNDEDFEEVLDRKLTALSKRSVLSRFTDRLVSAATVAEIHGVHKDTVLKYANAGLLPHQRTGKLYKFSLAEVLDVSFHDMKKQRT